MNNTLNYTAMVSRIRNELETYIKESLLQSLVIGISGGIDSALCAALARPVCDKLGIPLIGRSIPITTNTSDERDRAEKVGNAFCTNFDEVYQMEGIYKEVWNGVKTEGWEFESPNERIRQGNVKARMRMIILYDLAQLHKGMVLSTDNYTEFLLGFWTLHGDVGDYGMIQNLWKTEAYDMAEFLVDHLNHKKKADALRSCIDCQATDGLGISKTDLEQIMPSWKGTSREGYKLVDLRLMTHLGSGLSDLDDPVLQRYYRTEFKRLNPVNIPRDKIL
jgi:NAD+ synthase